MPIATPVRLFIIPFHVEAGEPRIYVPPKRLERTWWEDNTPRCIKDQLLYLTKQVLKSEAEPNLVEEVAAVEYLVDEEYEELYIFGFIRCKTADLTKHGWTSTYPSNFLVEKMIYHSYSVHLHLVADANAIIAKHFGVKKSSRVKK